MHFYIEDFKTLRLILFVNLSIYNVPKRCKMMQNYLGQHCYFNTDQIRAITILIKINSNLCAISYNVPEIDVSDCHIYD